jgi:hemerythrin superfamily protein
MPAKSTPSATRRPNLATAATNRDRRAGAYPPARRKTTRATPGVRKPRAHAQRSGDAIALLRADHRDVASMLAQVDRMTPGDARMGALVARICRELTVHATIEEEIFYPAARTVLKDASLVDEADVEHASVKALVAALETSAPGDDHYDAKVKVLGEYVRHHVKEEQDELFPKLRRTELDMKVLGERLAVRKRELAGVLADRSAADEAMRSFIPIV